MTTVTNVVADSDRESINDQQAQRQREKEDKLIARAKRLLLKRLNSNCELLTSVTEVRNYLVLQLANKHNEVFGCLFLDNKHRLLEYRELFFGTIDGCSVYPRIVVQEALRVNAAAVIFAHNHPSGVAEPSQSDLRITERLTQALELIDVRVLDHFVVGADEVLSFAAHGLLV